MWHQIFCPQRGLGYSPSNHSRQCANLRRYFQRNMEEQLLIELWKKKTKLNPGAQSGEMAGKKNLLCWRWELFVFNDLEGFMK